MSKPSVALSRMTLRATSQFPLDSSPERWSPSCPPRSSVLSSTTWSLPPWMDRRAPWASLRWQPLIVTRSTGAAPKPPTVIPPAWGWTVECRMTKPSTVTSDAVTCTQSWRVDTSTSRAAGSLPRRIVPPGSTENAPGPGRSPDANRRAAPSRKTWFATWHRSVPRAQVPRASPASTCSAESQPPSDRVQPVQRSLPRISAPGSERSVIGWSIVTVSR